MHAWAVLLGVLGSLALFRGSEAQCTSVTITSESGGSYMAQFSVTSGSTFDGLTVELTFDQSVSNLEFYAGVVEWHDDKYFKLVSSGWHAEPGYSVAFEIKVDYNGAKPLVVGALMNGADVCGGGGGVVTQPPMDSPCDPTGMGPYDYSQALCMSYLFYEAQRSGPLPADQRVTWRGDSAVSDGSDVGRDLSGGYYDAGDFVKFGFPMAFTATLLAWGLVDFPAGHEAAGQTEYGRAAVKWATDYFLKAHSSHFEFYGQVGDGYADHAYWGRPEDMTMGRPSMKIDNDHPGTELAGETAAALAAASMAFQDSDPTYASQMLDVAKELYDFADQRRQNYDVSIPGAADFYKSWSGYGDELCWAALWLARATGDSSYMTKARQHWDEFGIQNGADGFNWDDKKGGVYALYALMDSDPMFSGALSGFVEHIRNEKPYTPGGLVFLDPWGANRHAANVAYIALMVGRANKNVHTHTQAQSQVDCLLGSTGRSFVVGFGTNPPQRPHHRASVLPNPPASCSDGWAQNNPGPNPQVLFGALVGGPSQDGSYNDDRNDYVHNEVACDYNAGFSAALAALVELH
ncbi:endoglucanase E-4-like [Penaeus japonicus]|uniref:endoglucanase E-4-like n=1 Tax=Penaeus japonicus TaxID=27405 RepID=UPI001C712221|nr:endoglucanase E-4-like [Penaeus japonicus]